MANLFPSFKGRLLTLTLCISLIPIAAITMVYCFHAKGALKHQILEQMKAVAESKRLHIRSFMETKKGRTIDFSSDRFIRDRIERVVRGGVLKRDAVIDLNEYLSKKKLPLDNHLIAIAIADRHGKVVSSTNEKLIGKDVSDQDIFVQGINRGYGEAYITPRYFPYFGATCILSSAPIISGQDTKPLGVIINAHSLAFLSEITTNRVGMGKTGEVYLVNRGRIMVTESRFITGASLKQVVDTEPVLKIIEDDKEMVGIYPDYRGVPVVGSSLDIPEYGWILLSEIDKKEAFQPLKTLSIVALIFGIVGVASVTSVGIIFAVSTSRTIKDLTDAAERLAGGDLDYRVKVTRTDEIGALMNGFNAMADKLSLEIKEHKRAETELRKSKEQTQTILDNTTAIVYLKDTEGRYLLINHQFERLFHVTKDQVIGKTDYDIFPKAFADAFRINDCKVLETKNSLVIEEVVPQDDGMHTYISLKFPMYDFVEGLYGVCGISTDITERTRKIEKESNTPTRRQADK
ncbi:MAG: HAMP domain-containing protein [Candidatus Brocadia sp.]|nr:HAMP domain-containing protein [Candidatus Brocadia sp.]